MRGSLRLLLSSLCILLVPLAASGQSLDHVRVQLKWLHQFQFAGYYAALEKGYYRDAGLSVELIEGRSGVDPAHVVLEGKAEFGVGTPEILLLRAAGEPLVVLGVIFQHSPYSFIALESSGISNIGDFPGRRVMVEPQAAELYALLMREKIPVDQLTILPHTFSAESLTKGEADIMSAYSTDEPFFLQHHDIPYATFSPRSGGIDFYGDCFFTTEEQIARHPARVRAFYEATLKGWAYAMDHPEEIADLIIEKYHSKKSREALLYEAAEMRELMHPEIIPIGYMYRGRWQHIEETYRELGMIDLPVSLSRFLYDPNPRVDVTYLYWGIGIALGVALVACAILLPVLRLNRRLRAAKERAEAADRAKRNFVAVVSHELRTPMNGVLGFGGLLQKTILTTEQHDYVASINQSAEAVLGLINELLDFSKIESGRVEIESVPFPLPDLVREAVHFFAPLAAQKGIDLRSEIDPTLPAFVLGDRHRLRQILLNILSNACKFTERGHVLLRVRTCGPAQIEFSVEDTGPGLSAAEATLIFEPFHQGEQPIGQRLSGTGLGLPISKNLAHLLGGTLTFASQPGHGTTFTLTLPLPAAEPPASPPTTVPPEQPPALCRHTVLVAEDNPVSAKLMKSILTRLGCSPDLASDGLLAVETWQARRPQIVFMDLQMPALGGLEAIRRIRDLEGPSPSARTYIVALTAEAGDTVRDQCLGAGADSYLTKPVSPAQVEALLETITSRA